MNILSISTSSPTCSVALLDNKNCICELNILNTRTHSENLMPLINDLLISQEKSLSEINLIVCDNGPGSFTGIRIGIATVKGLALPLSIPTITISSLEGLAYNSISNNNICSLIDAKNNQVYCCIFDKHYNPITSYMADSINNLLPELNTYPNLTFVGDGAILHKELLKSNNIILDDKIHSKNIGLAGLKQFSLR